MTIDGNTVTQLLRSVVSQLTQLNTNMDTIRNDISELRVDMNNRVGKIEKEISSLQSIISDITHHQSLTDTHEVLISGIPQGINIENEKIVHKILSKLELPNLSPFIIKIRDWVRRSNNKSATSTVSNRTPSLSKPVPAQDRAIVVKFASVPVRDELVANSAKLKLLDANKIFETGGTKQISIRPLWPKPLYELCRAAETVAVLKNYVKPVIRNLTVLLRKTAQSNPIPIRNMADLTIL